MIQLFDVLAHLNDRRIMISLPLVLARAAQAGISDILSAGVDPSTDLALPTSSFPRVHRAYGIHPSASHTGDFAALDQRLDEPGVVCMGEIGLDARENMPPLDVQIAVLETQLRIAKARDLPIIFHCVRAHGLLLESIRRAKIDVPCAVHGFSGSPEQAKLWMDVGCYLSFGGLVTRPAAIRCRRSAAYVPLAHMLLESDAPDHSPSGVGSSEPADILSIAHGVSELKNCPWSDVAEITHRNACTFLRLAECPFPS